jgi:hypothetical protein
VLYGFTELLETLPASAERAEIVERLQEITLLLGELIELEEE